MDVDYIDDDAVPGSSSPTGSLRLNISSSHRVRRTHPLQLSGTILRLRQSGPDTGQFTDQPRIEEKFLSFNQSLNRHASVVVCIGTHNSRFDKLGELVEIRDIEVVKLVYFMG